MIEKHAPLEWASIPSLATTLGLTAIDASGGLGTAMVEPAAQMIVAVADVAAHSCDGQLEVTWRLQDERRDQTKLEKQAQEWIIG
jgi:hypothetical protein